ncbi:sugar transferase [Lacticaseibacillus parakribbianus]|uniref:sugar transferase n=1 Tax=Lacticaseibacillus parakribbianus TaxID=2970927 RepID=UPI0021CB565E|nr:sugar transferase [Lacticaseibacillus parakribbianus]
MQNSQHITTVTSAPVPELHQDAQDVALINVVDLDHQYVYRFVKRVFDIVASAAGLIVLSPLFAVLAFLIKKDDHGPVFFSQPRVGKNGRHFRMFKFRSMCVDAEAKLKQLLDQNEVDGAMFKMKDDPRITRIGRFIRRTSLDELPQLYNVLRGDMSLVGPRPPLDREVVEYTDYDRQRLAVTPGCTGLWQVGDRNNVGFQGMVALDLEYIEHRSLWEDIVILVKTVGIVFKATGI